MPALGPTEKKGVGRVSRIRVARTRAVAVALVALSLVLVGSGAAWAYWAVSRTVTVTGAGAAAPAPLVTATCDPGLSFQNDPVVVSWPAVPLPTGATQVRYRVKFVNSSGTAILFPTAGDTTATSVSVNATQLGPTADRTKVQTITVQAFYVFAGTTWTSAPSAPRTAQGQSTLFGFVDMYC